MNDINILLTFVCQSYRTVYIVIIIKVHSNKNKNLEFKIKK